MSPLAYVVMAVFFCVTSFLLVSGMEEASMRGAFGLIATMLIFIMPFLTMRSFAEEFASGTDELLMTSPVTSGQLVAGKFMAVMALAGAIIGLSAQYALIIGIYGDPDWGPALVGYAGLVLLSGALAAIGVFCSSLTRSQPAAAVAAFGVTLLLIVIRAAQSAVDSLAASFTGSASAQAAKAVSSVLEAAGPLDHYFDFEKGVVDSTHVVYFAAFILLFLFFTARRIDNRRF
jgi:ABC-2 type transport system permease protein